MDDELFVRSAEMLGLEIERVLPLPAWGRGQVRFLELKDGTRVVLKAVGSASAIQGLETGLSNELFDCLSTCSTHLCLPQFIAGSYSHEMDGRLFMVFPWVGSDFPAMPEWELSIEDHVEFISTVSSELAMLPARITRALREASFDQSFSAADFRVRLRQVSVFFGDEFCEACEQLWDRDLSSWEEDCFSQVVHGDLQTSNILRSTEGELVAVDVDNFNVANRYSDFLYVTAARGVSGAGLRRLEEFYRELGDWAYPPVNLNQLLLGFHTCLGFMATVAKRVATAAEAAGRDVPDMRGSLEEAGDLEWLRQVDGACLDSLQTQIPKFREVLSFLLFKRVPSLS